MAPESQRKGLLRRVKDALGVPEDETGEDLASRPQSTSTFTASRLPTGEGGPLGSNLFPQRQGKWELYEDAWENLDQRQPGEHEPDEPSPEPSLEPGPATEPDASWDPGADLDAPPVGYGDVPDEPWGAPAPAVDLGAPPPAPWDDEPQHELGDATIDDHDDPRALLESLDDEDVVALARVVGFEPPPAAPAPEPVSPAPPPPAAPPEPVAPEPPPPAAPAPPEPVATAPPEPDASVAPAPPEPQTSPAWRPTPDVEAVTPRGEGSLFAQPTHEVRDRLITSGPAPSLTPQEHAAEVSPGRDADDAESIGPPEPPQHDIGAERRIAVHEQALERAYARARAASAPEVQVHGDRLDTPVGPQEMTPSEALALAQRGRSAIGPREDVAPAS